MFPRAFRIIGLKEEDVEVELEMGGGGSDEEDEESSSSLELTSSSRLEIFSRVLTMSRAHCS